MHRAASAYFQTQITTTTQGDIVVMLYDGAIKFLTQAKEHLAANDMAKKGMAISKAMDVINELDSALNTSKGGELAQNLHNLYGFCTNRLFKANLHKSSEMVDEVIRILGGLREAYAEILTLPEAQAAAEQAAAGLPATAALPARGQTGRMPAGPAAPAVPAPALNARMRNMYAKTALQPAETLQEAAQQEPPAAENAPEHTLAAPAVAPESVEQADAAPRQDAPSSTGFSLPSGFGRRQGVADAYRKQGGLSS